MAKMTGKMRQIVFENAIKKLYGDRLADEKEAYEIGIKDVVLKMVKRIAKKNGVEYESLITAYKPYLNLGRRFYFRSDAGYFTEELNQIFFNENFYVLQYEGTCLEIVREYRDQKTYYVLNEDLPSTNAESFSDSERKEIVAIFKAYANFMKEVVSSACAIRDVINSCSTTKQLTETSPELGELIPETEGCVSLVPIETVKKVSALFHK